MAKAGRALNETPARSKAAQTRHAVEPLERVVSSGRSRYLLRTLTANHSGAEKWEAGRKPPHKWFPLPRRRGLRFLRAAHRLIPASIIAASVVAALLVFLLHDYASDQLRERLRQENRMALHSTMEHAEDYFDAVYSTLEFVSQDENIKALRRGSEGFIQRLYDHQWEHHGLAEIYVVQRDFQGDRRPFLTFEHEPETDPANPVHAQARELEEYRVQIQQIREFLANTNLDGLISPELNLCVNDEHGRRARGLVYSVPIHSEEGLTGIVAGMIRSAHLMQAIGRDPVDGVALLANERGEIYAGPRTDPHMVAWFKARFAGGGPAAFFAGAPELFSVDQWVASYTPVKVVSAEKWWLVYLFDEEAALRGRLFFGKGGALVLSAALVMLGLAMAVAARSSARLLEQQVLHLSERERLERQVQDVSEREQRRIGQDLHEDLCQRLTGISAACRALQKRLKAADQSELARSIVENLHDSLTRTLELADELQPVSLLSEGFVASMQKLAARSCQRGRATCQLQTENFPDLEDAELATQLYRIVQEALANAVRHADATQITISLSADATHLMVSITDNGKGLPPNAAEGPGMGLRIMRYRSERINGDLEIAPVPAGGTRVTCRCPRPPA